jgi:hypothetical protein
MALPEVIAENGDVFDFGLIAEIVWVERATEKRGDAEKFEGVWREELLVDGFGEAVFAECDAAALACDEALGGSGVGFYFLKLAERNRGVALVLILLIEDVGEADAICAGVGIRVDEDGVDDAEDGGGGADAESEGEDGEDGGEAGSGYETKGIAQIMHKWHEHPRPL